MLTDSEFDTFMEERLEMMLESLRQDSFLPFIHVSLEGGISSVATMGDMPPPEVRRDAFIELGKLIKRALETETPPNIRERNKDLKMDACGLAVETWIAPAVPEDDPRRSLMVSQRDDKDECLMLVCLTPDGRSNGAKIHIDREPAEEGEEGRIIVQQVERMYVGDESAVRPLLLEAFIKGFCGRFPVNSKEVFFR